MILLYLNYAEVAMKNLMWSTNLHNWNTQRWLRKTWCSQRIYIIGIILYIERKHDIPMQLDHKHLDDLCQLKSLYQIITHIFKSNIILDMILL